MCGGVVRMEPTRAVRAAEMTARVSAALTSAADRYESLAARVSHEWANMRLTQMAEQARKRAESLGAARDITKTGAKLR